VVEGSTWCAYVTGPIRVFAPARIDLSAGFTDVEPFSDEIPARIVNVALDLGVEVAVRDEPSAAPSASFAGGLRDAIARRLAIEPPVVELAASPLPPGSGLGASGALTVALAYALSLRAGSSVEAAELVELACAAERDVGLTGGTQDQLASVHGGAGVVRRHRDTGRRDSIMTDLEALGARLVLVHGSGRRNSGAIIEQVLELCSRATVLRTIRAMNEVGESLAHHLRVGDHDGLAALVNESTALLCELHPAIVDDGMNRRLRAFGASAAKPCGAGGAGAAWLTLVDPPRRTEFAAAVTKAGLTVLPTAPRAEGAQVRPR
jgi:D-glycero-alpha-D-manno-heptose-7-phosphate kinase